MTSTPRRWASITTSLPSSPEPSSSRRVPPSDSGVPSLTVKRSPASIAARADEERQPDGIHLVGELRVAQFDPRKSPAPAIAHAGGEALAAAILVDGVVGGGEVTPAVLAGHVEVPGALQRQRQAHGGHLEFAAVLVEGAVFGRH